MKKIQQISACLRAVSETFHRPTQKSISNLLLGADYLALLQRARKHQNSNLYCSQFNFQVDLRGKRASQNVAKSCLSASEFSRAKWREELFATTNKMVSLPEN